ncbi:polymorphic toxin-type HINT domain-containing protein [Streptomyces sp. NPDC127112]|uniref:polymorphic toxin-type HINT domain-containing protein n=1 Tax=Streptomyces sp. NPDC127112 TaxID=3345364 RepID=UPI0036346D46
MVGKRERWVDAADLNTGDTLRTPDGTTVEVREVTHWKTLQPAYNLTVNDLHTYHVLAAATPLLVHNAKGCAVGRPRHCASDWLFREADQGSHSQSQGPKGVARNRRQRESGYAD